MTLSNGLRLGPYEVVAPLGAGGMGEVWRARDTRLERSVAIKVLPSDFAQNAQLRLRFEREAKAISQLAHPHICTVYDVGREAGVDFLVMEYLEGETLADRIAKGPLPLEQIVRYGIQIAEALEKAHKAGVVHRDVKPGNIMLTKGGAKLLDFGLAKPVAVGVADALTVRKSLTEEGTIVGTFQYMAPEQIEAGDVDARSDIFALGAMLYEMATGRRAFNGKTKASLIACILTSEPAPISAIQPMTPASLDRVVRTCLAKDPDERWQSAHDVAVELGWIAEAQPATTGTRRAVLPWMLAALLLIATIAAGVALWRGRAESEPPTRSFILPPDGTMFDFRTYAAPPALSADGRRIVFGAAPPGKKRTLRIRLLDSITAQQLPGTEDATFPFWSPDGRFVGFFIDNALEKIEVAGGTPVRICNVLDGRGGSWSPDGQTIVFAGRYSPIYRVPAVGGTPVEVTAMAGPDATHRWPVFLPDGRHFLFLASRTGSEDETNTICVGSIDGKMRKPLVSRADEPHYTDGVLLFVRDQILMAQRFDPKTLTLSGEAVPLKEQQIESASLLSKSYVAVSANGTLIYQMGTEKRDTQLTWFDRSGHELGKEGDPTPYLMVNLMPDGKSAVYSLATSPRGNIWSFDFARGVKSRMTFGSGWDVGALASPDGKSLAYFSVQAGKSRLMLKNLIDGSERVLLDVELIGGSAVTSWSADSKTIFFNIGGRKTRGDIWWMSVNERVPHLFVGTAAIESNGRLSPDGKWLAYFVNEANVGDIYIAPFPPTGAKWQVSSGGGSMPRWSADGKELFYVVVGTPSTMMAVPIALGATPDIGHAVKLFQFQIGLPTSSPYDVTRDGQRFLVNTRIGDEPAPQPLILLQHFDQELRAALKEDR